MPIKMYFKSHEEQSEVVNDTLMLTFVGELKRDTDRKVVPAFVAIEFYARDLAVSNLADLPRLLREKATRMQEKINQLTAGSRQETTTGGIIENE